jgi:hypothetical protein
MPQIFRTNRDLDHLEIDGARAPNHQSETMARIVRPADKVPLLHDCAALPPVLPGRLLPDRTASCLSKSNKNARGLARAGETKGRT